MKYVWVFIILMSFSYQTQAQEFQVQQAQIAMFHELGSRKGTRIGIVNRNDQVSRVYATLETAATFDFMNGRAVLGGMNHNA